MRRRRRRGGGGGGGGEREERREPATPAPAPPVARAAPAAPRAATEDDEPELPKFVPEVDDGAPAPAVELAPDLPREPVGDLDPASAGLAGDPGDPGDDDGAALLAQTVINVVGVRLAAAGKIVPFDAGEQRFARGDRVIVDSDRGPRLATVAAASVRRPAAGGSLRRVLRRAHDADLRHAAEADDRSVELLRLAKEAIRNLDLPVKVFRVESQPGRRLLVYFTSEERIDLRDFLRDLGQATGARIELRQIGARDEAKLVGGIGSCGLELCCSTWLPEMVPVSIKMAKDQGLVLNPQKVSGQCGRLKCCLVYEQATYAELRKGLPKLGKRVITAYGEGRVVEVDVLRQRIRVATGPGEHHVLTADEVKPLFPSQHARAQTEEPDDS